MAQAAENFLRTVLKSGLLDRDQLQTALRGVPKAGRGDPLQLADHLVKHGKLSAFQAKKLLQGVYHGLILDHFQVLAPIGRGGMGTVYLAQDTRTHQKLALKVLSPKRARQEDKYLARFQREMTLSQRVSHPNLARSLEVGVYQGVYFIAMEYIPGKSLFRLVSDEGPLAVPRAARLFAEVASVLEYAHGQGVIHRDLKPSNIMITPNDHAKVLDLGLALREGEPEDEEVVGGPGLVVGSFDYIAPEQAENSSRVDGRADVYALGCSLYFALTKQAPFPGGDKRDKLKRHRKEEPVPLARLNPAVPEKFALVVKTMMAKHPEERYSTATALREELERWSDQPARPVDAAGDTGFRAAVAAVETEATGSDSLVDVPNVAPPKEIAVLEPIVLDESEEKNDLWWIVLGLIGFWVVILLGLGLVLLLR